MAHRNILDDSAIGRSTMEPPPPPLADPVAHNVFAVVASANQLATIPEFCGKQTENIRLWITQIERSQKQFNWDDASTSAATQSRMQGAAASWLQSEMILGRKYPAFAGDNGLRQALLKRFAEQITQLSAIKALKEITQKKGESIDEFRDRLMVALDRKNFHIPDAEKEGEEYKRNIQSELFSFMGAGMLDEVRTRTMATPRPPTNADELVVAARAVECELLNCTSKQTYAVDDLKNEIETIVAEVLKKSSGQDKSDRKKQATNVSATTRCYRCQGFAHMAADCPSKHKTWPKHFGRGRNRGRGGRGNFSGGRGRHNNNGYQNQQQNQNHGHSNYPQNQNNWTHPFGQPNNQQQKPRQVWEIEDNSTNWGLPSFPSLNSSGNSGNY